MNNEHQTHNPLWIYFTLNQTKTDCFAYLLLGETEPENG